MYLGIDIGTSSIKAVVISDENEILAVADSPLKVSHPDKNFSEQNPADWLKALRKTISVIHSKLNLHQIKRIGLTGQMHGATCLDKNSKLIRPCILWNDGRAIKESNDLNSLGDRFTKLSGNIAMPGFTAPKILWMKNNEPDNFSRIDKVLLPKDYLRYVLTSEFATDSSDASGTLWLNPETRKWDNELIKITGINESWLPEVFEGPDETGMVSSSASKEFGLPRVPVVAGGGDNACASLALGIYKPRESFISLGTSGVLFYVSEEHQSNPDKTVHAFTHALPNTWHQMTVTLSAAESLSWLSRVLSVKIDDLLKNLLSSKKRNTEVIFLPYLDGERSPHNDPNARGLFLNLSSSTVQEDLTLAVLEGVAYSFNDGKDALQESGASFKEILSIGGGSKSEMWLQIISDSLNSVIQKSDSSLIGPSLGAARLAMPFSESNFISEPVNKVFEPDQEQHSYHADKLSKYREAYKNNF